MSSSIKNKSSLSQEKFKKDFNRVIHEIYAIFHVGYSNYIRNGFSVGKIKEEYNQIKDFVITNKTNIHISRDNTHFIREKLVTIHTCCILNLINGAIDLKNIMNQMGIAFWEEQHKEYQTAIQKNQDYGDSFREHGFMGVLVRLSDKVKRLVHISSGKKIIFEAQEDTFKDLANYCVMGIFLLDENEDKTNKNFNTENKYQWACNYCTSNQHDLYSNEKDKNDCNFKVLKCPVLKDKQYNSFCNYCKEYGHCIYYRYGEKYKNNDDKKLYTCPKLIKKMKGHFQRKWPEDYEEEKEKKWPEDFPEERNPYGGHFDRGAPCGPYDAFGNYKPGYDDCGPW